MRNQVWLNSDHEGTFQEFIYKILCDVTAHDPRISITKFICNNVRCDIGTYVDEIAVVLMELKWVRANTRGFIRTMKLNSNHQSLVYELASVKRQIQLIRKVLFDRDDSVYEPTMLESPPKNTHGVGVEHQITHMDDVIEGG